jgi:hypothetical protein
MASKKLKRLSFQRQFEALKRASWSERSTTTCCLKSCGAYRGAGKGTYRHGQGS